MMDDLDYDNSAAHIPRAAKRKVSAPSASSSTKPCPSTKPCLPSSPKSAKRSKEVKAVAKSTLKQKKTGKKAEAKKESKDEKKNRETAEGMFSELLELAAEHADISPPDHVPGQPIRALEVLNFVGTF